MISNLHSLLNRPWYINQQYAQAQLPLVINMLKGKASIEKQEVKNFVAYRSTFGSTTLKNNDTQGKIVAVIDLKDTIYKYDQDCGPAGTQSKMQLMDSLKNNEKIAGIVLDIDSGGGQVSGTPEFYDYIKTYPKPVITYTGGYMCSAAYYIGSAGKKVIANKRAEAIGSIGAYIQFLDLEGYYEKEGAKLHTIYATKSTEKNKAYKEALKGNYDLMVNEELDPIVNTFIKDMKVAMPNIKEDVFKGATYNSKKALNLGLIDSIGTLQDAVNEVYKLSNSTTNNNKTMSKERKQLQATLGLETPLAATADKGSYLNETQLDAIEAKIVADEATVNTANTAKATAEDATKTANDKATTLETAVNTLASKIEVEKGATTQDTINAIEAKFVALGKKPAATHTKVAQDPTAIEEDKHDYIDFESSIYTN